MYLYQLNSLQKLPLTINEAWDFFSSPLNLQKITPKEMSFEVTLIPENAKMYEGMIIAYKVKPLLNIPMRWVTEITHVDELNYFVDEQRFGPYKMWHHQHHFKEIEGGVEMKDIVSYVVPFGFLGKIANGLFVRKKLKKIFDYRFQILEEYFGKINT